MDMLMAMGVRAAGAAATGARAPDRRWVRVGLLRQSQSVL
jgi:hypothetical protein